MKTIISNFLPVRTRNSLVSDKKFSGFLSRCRCLLRLSKFSCWWKFFKEIITILDNLFSNYKLLLINKI